MEVTAFLFICGHCRETEGRRERVVFGAEGGGRGETKVCEFDGRTAGDTSAIERCQDRPVGCCKDIGPVGRQPAVDCGPEGRK